MDWTVCSRESERDYTWDNTRASQSVAEGAQGVFAPAFEGSLTTSRFAALLRCPGSPSGVMLGTSVSTVRKDAVGRPIRTMAFLRAERPEETDFLAAFFAECLRKPDQETLYNADSSLARAVESLYQTKKPDEFVAFCKGLPSVPEPPPVPKETPKRKRDEQPAIRIGGMHCRMKPPDWEPGPPDEAMPLQNRSQNRRGEMESRCRTVDKLAAIIRSGAPFLVALTDRNVNDLFGSLGSAWAKTPARVFSKQTSALRTIPDGAGLSPEEWKEPASQKYIRAAAIGGAVVLALLVAAIGPCSRRGGEGEAARATDAVNPTNSIGARLEGGGTNVPPSKGVAETNTPTGGRNGGTNAPPSGIAPVGPASVATNNVPPKAEAMTPRKDPFDQH